MSFRLPFPWKVRTGDLLGSLPTLPILWNFPFYNRRLNEHTETCLIFTMYSPLAPRLLTLRTYLVSFAVFLEPQLFLLLIFFFLFLQNIERPNSYIWNVFLFLTSRKTFPFLGNSFCHPWSIAQYSSEQGKLISNIS